ncbi:MAG: hypothetical protein ACFFC7_20095 [Candidatus Hermodarchaeota archaeon]
MDKKTIGCVLICLGFFVGYLSAIFINYDIGVLLFVIAVVLCLFGFLIVVIADIDENPEQYGLKGDSSRD